MTAARLWRVALVLCGLGLLVYLIAEIGPAAIADSFRILSWRLLVVLVFPCIVFKVFDTLGWLWTFPGKRPSFLLLVKVRLVGQAVNATTPTGTLGGDAVKTWLLRDRVKPRESLASLIAVKTTMIASQGLFLALGVVLARRVLPVQTTLLPAMEFLLVLESIAVVGFIAVQAAGVIRGGQRLLARFGVSGGTRFGEAATDVDRALVTFYRRRQGSLVLSIPCNLLGRPPRAGRAWL